MVRVIGREDVQWNRKLFKAPPLDVKLPVTGLTNPPTAVNLRKSAATKQAQ